jgi:hypothetical protein
MSLLRFAAPYLTAATPAADTAKKPKMLLSSILALGHLLLEKSGRARYVPRIRPRQREQTSAPSARHEESDKRLNVVAEGITPIGTSFNTYPYMLLLGKRAPSTPKFMDEDLHSGVLCSG